ncbi:MAG: glycosyltransferase family 1 protein [Candidatus Berkelbacteria bacterium]
MKIGIDASLAASKSKTGVENYVYEITKRLGQFSRSEIILYTNLKLGEKIENTTEKNIPFFKFWRSLRLPLALLSDKPDVFFEPANFLPWFAPKNSVVTVHDLAVKRYPSAYSFFARMRLNYFYGHTSKHAKKIIVVSETTKNDMIMYYPESKEKIEVIYPSYNQIFNNDKKTTSPMKDKYILFVGRLEARKNIKNIVLAFEKFKAEHKLSHKLILVGNPGYGYTDAKSLIENNPDIILAGHKNATELVSYYKNADCLLYPSLYEGFGMPILESMACATPVIVSNDKWAREVGGEAGYYVESSSVSEIASAIGVLTTDHYIHDQYAQKGLKNVQRFSWDKSVKEIVKLLEAF